MVKINNINIYFPLKLKPREQQLEALNFLKQSINNGKRYCLLNLPTGSGKSYLIMMFANWYRNFVNKYAKFDILTNSKILQNQYINEFPFIKDYRGKSNFYCDPHDTTVNNGKSICSVLGPYCGIECPYENAKKIWQDSDIGLTNFHLFNTIAIYAKKILEGRDSHVLVIDEAHDFESVFCDFITISMSAKSLKKYGFDLKEIEDYDNRISRIKKISDFIGFIKHQFVQDVTNKYNWLEEKIKNATPKLRLEYSGYKSHCENQLFKFDYLIKEFEKKPDNWILDITKTNDKMYSGLLLEAKPVWGNDYIKEKIFNKYDHVIFMSGSILDKTMFSYINGLETELTTYFEVPSTFPLNRRPIYYLKLGKMTWEQKEKTFKEQLKYIDKILKKNKDRKGIIHSGSYEFTQWLQEQYINKRLIFHTPDNRDEMLDKHINSDKPTVIVSPSMISGVDLKDDLSRFQIILKIPFPFLGSEKIKQRQKTKPEWYSWKTVCNLIQMSGRSIRSHEDWAETFILDSSLSDLLKYNSKLIPRWYSDSIRELKI
ncbi:MAG: DEAD/DEAH box helicase family protein [Ignavibacteria bacterium]|nr:DEAD/DEAH box helicase family protein [Ignavibacteria bacterium]